ncbi:MAG: PilT/PilU family type 4a pilus ATPase [Candidatus Nomurabacteria bacterium]|nr:PilT/PilU family type 4a pilus ATPase [Candidatus Nomurabacteria bacterium]
MNPELKNIIDSAIREQASDIHFSVGRHPFIRVSGELISLESLPVITDESVRAGLAMMVTEKKLAELDEGQEIDFSYQYEEKDVRFRGNAYIQSTHVGIAMRLLQKVKAISDLNLPPILEQFAKRKQGFFLIVGPVGQGKSTTMAAMIDRINHDRRERIVTIEDPIEYLFEDDQSMIEQREVGIDTKSFYDALKAIFRQDANVIAVGEMRGRDTIQTAVTAAETGHLVLSTLHTNDAAQTIDRIIDAFPGDQQEQIRVQLSNTLIGIFSQRLLTTTTGARVPAYELLINNNAVANLIREGRTHEINSVIETHVEDGMVSLNRSLSMLVRQGVVSLEEARRYSLNPLGLDQLL